MKRQWLDKLKRKLYETLCPKSAAWEALSPEERRRAKMFMLGGGAGCLRPDADGVVRIEELKADELD